MLASTGSGRGGGEGSPAGLRPLFPTCEANGRGRKLGGRRRACRTPPPSHQRGDRSSCPFTPTAFATIWPPKPETSKMSNRVHLRVFLSQVGVLFAQVLMSDRQREDTWGGRGLSGSRPAAHVLCRGRPLPEDCSLQACDTVQSCRSFGLVAIMWSELDAEMGGR